MTGGGLTVGELRATLAALPGDAMLLAVVRDVDGYEAWADEVRLGVVGDPGWRGAYASLDVLVDTRMHCPWGPDAPDPGEGQVDF